MKGEYGSFHGRAKVNKLGFFKNVRNKEDGDQHLLCEEDAGVGTSVKRVGGDQLSKVGVQL